MSASAGRPSFGHNIDTPINTTRPHTRPPPPLLCSPPPTSTNCRTSALRLNSSPDIAAGDRSSDGSPLEPSRKSLVVEALESINWNELDECSETYASILQYCRSSSNFELGLQIHGHLVVSGVELSAFLGSQLLEFYCKFGLVDDERRLFENLPVRNLFSWTSMMGLHCKLGDYEERPLGCSI